MKNNWLCRWLRPAIWKRLDELEEEIDIMDKDRTALRQKFNALKGTVKANEMRARKEASRFNDRVKFNEHRIEHHQGALERIGKLWPAIELDPKVLKVCEKCSRWFPDKVFMGDLECPECGSPLEEAVSDPEFICKSCGRPCTLKSLPLDHSGISRAVSSCCDADFSLVLEDGK